MRKTVDLSKEQIKAVEEFQNRNKLKSFTKAIQVIVDKNKEQDELAILLTDAIVKIDKKLDVLIGSIAPKHAGEI